MQLVSEQLQMELVAEYPLSRPLGEGAGTYCRPWICVLFARTATDVRAALLAASERLESGIAIACVHDKRYGVQCRTTAM